MVLSLDGRAANLEELRGMFAGRVALGLMAVGGIGALQSLPRAHFPAQAFVTWSALLILALLGWFLNRPRPLAARYLLIGGTTALLLVAMATFPAAWLPLFGLLIISFGAMLVSRIEVACALALIGGMVWLTLGGRRSYDLVDLSAVLLMGTVLARLVVFTFDEALQWAWSMQERADDLLEQTRSDRAELGRALKSMELVYDLQSRTQHELIFARKQAVEARQVKQRFAANVSHELRTPLNLIMGFSELIALSPEVYGSMDWPPALRRDIQQIYRSSSHLLAMIDDILDLSRFEIVGLTLRKEVTDLADLVRNTVEITRELFRDQPVSLELELEPELPALELDRTRIRQVLLNLLNNAHRFTEHGCVTVRAARRGGEAVIMVSDTGPGIPEHKLEYLFDEFYQVDISLSRNHGGSGLGLAICKRFVEAHEGRIWVESSSGVGSTFAFALPIPEEYIPAPYLRDEDYRADPFKRPAYSTVLVVDPDPVIGALLRRRLGAYDVIQVRDEAQVATEVEACHPRAVIYNVSPGQTSAGLPAAEADALRGVPVFECSLPSPAWMARDLSVIACLTKPVRQAEVIGQIDRLGAKRILIVDDDREFVQLIRRMLAAGGQGFEVRHAYSGARGLVALGEERPDLLLLDLMMPEMDGFEMLASMRANPELENVPVVLLTATTYSEDLMNQRAGVLTVRRGDGLQPPEVLRCLDALVDALEPRYEAAGVPLGMEV
jgi:signal transduction histidine kinase/CheY-like chemotaxis protein